MTNDDSKPAPVATPPPPPVAWQPLTPRGVAAFAHATLGRLLLIELIIAVLAAAAVVWFLSAAWFPAVRQAIHQLPEQGTIRNQVLVSPLTWRETLAENRPFIIFVLDLEKQSNASQTSDVLIEFHKKNFQVCSLFGCFLFDYPKGWNIEFNHPKLAPLWDAWEPILLGVAGLFVLLFVFLSWALLATFYSGMVCLLGFFKDRNLNWPSSWRLASAALMPGALLLITGIFCYGLRVVVVDLLRLLLVFLLHFVTGWVYLAISPFYVPRIPSVAPAGVNPFAPSASEPKREPKSGS